MNGLFNFYERRVRVIEELRRERAWINFLVLALGLMACGPALIGVGSKEPTQEMPVTQVIEEVPQSLRGGEPTIINDASLRVEESSEVHSGALQDSNRAGLEPILFDLKYFDFQIREAKLDQNLGQTMLFPSFDQGLPQVAAVPRQDKIINDNQISFLNSFSYSIPNSSRQKKSQTDLYLLWSGSFMNLNIVRAECRHSVLDYLNRRYEVGKTQKAIQHPISRKWFIEFSKIFSSFELGSLVLKNSDTHEIYLDLTLDDFSKISAIVLFRIYNSE